MKKIFLLLILLSLITNVFSENLPVEQVKWSGIRSSKDNTGKEIKFLYFAGASYLGDQSNIPVLNLQYPLNTPDLLVTAAIVNPVFQELSPDELQVIDQSLNIGAEIFPKCSVGIIQKKAYALVNLTPLRRNPLTNQLEKLLSYQIELIEAPKPGPTIAEQTSTYASSSVLGSGNWLKFAINQTGVYKLTYNDLQAMGLDVLTLDPRNIRIYGNGSSPLPEANAGFRYDDLRENAIQVVGQDDGKFDPADYILFYGTAPVQWVYSTLKKRLVHKPNYYTDYTYYFITADLGPGLRLKMAPLVTQVSNKQLTVFDDYAVHDLDQFNLIKSGKTWYGEKFDLKLSYDLPPFFFPNVVTDSMVTMETDVAARSTSVSYFKVKVNGGEAASFSVPAYNPNAFNTDFALTSTSVKKFYLDQDNNPLTVSYVPYVSGSIGWLNYIDMTVLRQLKMVDHQMNFRSLSSVGIGKVSAFNLTGITAASMRFWDVTDPTRPLERPSEAITDGLKITVPTDSLREFIAFDGTSYLSISSSQKISNQNLHALGDYDMLIVYAPEFEDQVNKLMEIHQNQGLHIVKATPAAIFNEFSSGCQDMCAIRDFSRMLYNRAAPGKELKYLLLFGDASYDFKQRISNNTNFILTYQSLNSLRPTESYATDDFFGLLDPNEGDNCTGNLDLGIGRFPVKTKEEADAVINKIERYLGMSDGAGQGAGFSNNVPRLSDWRNTICFVADDEDQNMHIDQAEDLAAQVNGANHEYNLDKIYFDSYVQVSTPGGNRFPDVQAAINKRVAKGALIINYTGHGGETGWAHERVLEISDINSWENTQAMPVFVTATCEFSRFDDPERNSAGELVFLNPNGGGISLFTTTRLSFAATNFALNMNFYQHAFEKINGGYPNFEMITGGYPNMGDVMRKAKTPSNPQILNFVLLGDPALAIAYPLNRVVTTTLNGKAVGTSPDTIKAFTYVTLSGYIRNDVGAKVTSFNGSIYPTVFDKPVEITTLANDPESYPRTFELQKSVIYKGKASVVNGDFSFSFYVPRDIAYNLGKGKISYYAENGVTDANGYYDNFFIGGSESQIEPDTQGPAIQLYMNDTTFKVGGMTDENPILLALVSDEHGINTVGNGIGHDIVAVMDDQTDKSIVLNDFYTAQLNSFQRGYVRYPYTNLTEGYHDLSLKVWDIYNNSSIAYTNFIVVKSGNLTLENLMNFPNPFIGTTSFVFNHNQAGGKLTIDLRIYSLTGEEVKNMHATILPEGYSVGPLRWDGTNEQGARIAGGMYIYRVRVTNEAGMTEEKSSKLIVLN